MTEETKSTEDHTVFVGSKPFMNYVTGVVMQFTTQEAKEVTVKARGKFISRAVDIAEVATRRFLEGQVEVKDIAIDSEEFENTEGKQVRVSTIEIKMGEMELHSGLQYYLFVIDTDKENFPEKNLCAYITGRIDDYADEYIRSVPGEAGAQAEIAKKENPDLVEICKEIICLDYDDEDGLQSISTLFKGPYFGNEEWRIHPVYFSVGIHIEEEPDGHLVNSFKERAEAFAAKNNFNIKGYRILKKIVNYEEI